MADPYEIPEHLVEQMRTPYEPEPHKECGLCLDNLDPEGYVVTDGGRSTLCFECWLHDEERNEAPLRLLEELDERFPPPPPDVVDR